MSNIQQIQDLLRDINLYFDKIKADPQHVSRIYIDLLNSKIVTLYDYTVKLTTEGSSFQVKKEELVIKEIPKKEILEKLPEIEKVSEPVIAPIVVLKEVKEEIMEEKIPVSVSIPTPVSEPKIIKTDEEKQVKLDEPIAEKITPVVETIKAEPEIVVPDEKIIEVVKEEIQIKQETPEQFPPIRNLQDDLINIAREQMQKKALNERFAKNEPSINERIASTKSQTQLADSLQKGPITDIKTAITLNMKLAIIKDLFNGDQKDYKNLIDFLSKCRNYSEAKLFLQEEKQKHPQWESKPEQFNYLLELINRRFRA